MDMGLSYSECQYGNANTANDAKSWSRGERERLGLLASVLLKYYCTSAMDTEPLLYPSKGHLILKPANDHQLGTQIMAGWWGAEQWGTVGPFHSTRCCLPALPSRMRNKLSRQSTGKKRNKAEPRPRFCKQRLTLPKQKHPPIKAEHT